MTERHKQSIAILASGGGSTAEAFIHATQDGRVADGIDRGPKIAEHPVEVIEGDTAQGLFDRVQVVEKAALPYVIGKFLHEQGGYLGNS